MHVSIHLSIDLLIDRAISLPTDGSIDLSCSTWGLVAMASDSHAEGRQFDPGLVYVVASSFSLSFSDSDRCIVLFMHVSIHSSIDLLIDRYLNQPIHLSIYFEAPVV